MSTPPLTELLRWMAEMPAAFRGEPEGFGQGKTRVRAVVADLFATFFGQVPDSATLDAFTPADSSDAEHNRLRWVLAAAHLLWHQSFREQPPSQPGAQRLLIQEMAVLAAVVSVDKLDTEQERREELIRRTLRIFARTVAGETPNESADRFKQVDSVERRRVLTAAAERERRTRKVREAMAKKAAQEAAAKVSRE